MSIKLVNSVDFSGLIEQLYRQTYTTSIELISYFALFFVILSGIAHHYQQYITSSVLYLFGLIFDILDTLLIPGKDQISILDY